MNPINRELNLINIVKIFNKKRHYCVQCRKMRYSADAEITPEGVITLWTCFKGHSNAVKQFKKGKPRCYLDKRRKCPHPNLTNFCTNNMMICEELKPIRGEWHEILTMTKWQQEHRGSVHPEHFASVHYCDEACVELGYCPYYSAPPDWCGKNPKG